jgi:hypothetical protein
VTVNALIPGLVDAPLARYQKRLTESIEETGQTAPDHTTPTRVAYPQAHGSDESRLAATGRHRARPSDAAAMVTGAE